MSESRRSYIVGDVEIAKDKAFQKEHINGTIRIPAFAEVAWRWHTRRFRAATTTAAASQWRARSRSMTGSPQNRPYAKAFIAHLATFTGSMLSFPTSLLGGPDFPRPPQDAALSESAIGCPPFSTAIQPLRQLP